MAANYGFDEPDDYMLLTQAGKLRVESMVEPKYISGASISKIFWCEIQHPSMSPNPGIFPLRVA